MVSLLFGILLDKRDDIAWISGTEERELISTCELHDDIWHTEKRCPPWSSPYLDTFDLLVGDIEEIGREPLPSHIDNRTLCHDPDIHIPIEYLIHQESIDTYHIDRSIYLCTEGCPETEEIIRIEKRWDDEPEKYP